MLQVSCGSGMMKTARTHTEYCRATEPISIHSNNLRKGGTFLTIISAPDVMRSSFLLPSTSTSILASIACTFELELESPSSFSSLSSSLAFQTAGCAGEYVHHQATYRQQGSQHSAALFDYLNCSFPSCPWSPLPPVRFSRDHRIRCWRHFIYFAREAWDDDKSTAEEAELPLEDRGDVSHITSCGAATFVLQY